MVSTVVSAAGGEATLGDHERRLEALLGRLPYLALGVSLVLVYAVRLPGSRPFGYDLVLSVIALGWLAVRSLMDRFRLDEGRCWAAGAHFAVQVALICQLVLANPLFGFFAFTGYVHAMRHLTGRRRLMGVAVVALPTALSQTGGLLPLTPGLGVVYGVALVFNLTVVGVMITLRETAERLSVQRRDANTALAAANERLALMLAENAGLHAQLIGQAREAGVMDERRRMAREIHDTVAQGLAGIVTQLQAADGLREHHRDLTEADRHLGNAARLARASLADARRAVAALRPETLEQAGLPVAIGEAVASWRELHGATAELTVTGTPVPLHPEVEITLLRAAQEALSNAAKHAAATRVGLTLSYMEDVVTLDARDDGAGFDPAALPEPGAAGGTGGGFGLAAMRQRVRRLGGVLEIESEPGGGTALSATVPAVAAGDA